MSRYLFSKRSLILLILLVLALVSSGGLQPMPAQAISSNIVISQVYGGGGNSGAPYTHDFIELFNRGTSTASLAGWSLQYASATGTGNFGANPVVALSGSLAPGQSYLVRLSGGTTGVTLPTPDATGTINASATAGKFALVNATTGLACNGGSTPCSPAQLAQIVDLVGYGNANFFEGAGAAPSLSNTTAAIRNNNGCTETDNNAADFTAGTPAPRNTASPLNPCGGNQPVVITCGPAVNTIQGTAATRAITASDADGVVTSIVINNITPATGAITLSGLLPASGIGGTANATVNVSNATPAGSFTVQLTAANNNLTPQTGTCNLAVNVTPLVAIRDIQGTSHTSPRTGQVLATTGIVTAKRANGFYLQDSNVDANPATSEAIFVFTSSAPTVNVGDALRVTGTVTEFRAGGSSSTNLTLTELTAPTIVVQSSGNALPAPIVIGAGGRVPPGTIIDDDATGSVETSGSFDALTDGIDFYESLESMRVQINNAVAVGPTNAFGEIPVIADNGASAAMRTTRGGIVIRANDYNPERILLDNEITATPNVNVGAKFASAVGVLDYSFGNFKLMVTASPVVVTNGLTKEVTDALTAHQLAIATFNVENLDANDPQSKFDALAALIVNNLRSPDIISVEEIQDNNGATNDGTVDATTTYNKLIAAISAAGGPAYQFRQINPVNNQDGGETGGNIRVGFLFRTNRGVAFIDRPGGTSTNATSVSGTGLSTQLSFSPGRIDPTNSAFNTSRKPLAGEFTFKGDKVFVIANHWNSKGGDHPLFGRFQPPVLSSETQRNQQATVVKNFVASLLTADANANVIVLGDLNDFEFSNPLNIIKSAPLKALIETLPPAERYSYVYDGNSQTLDHILVSNAIFGRPFTFDSVHVNAEFVTRASDHDPQIARVCVDRTLPNITVAVSPNKLWPPQHQYVNVQTTVNVSDNADPNPSIALVSVTSSEPDDELGDGDTPDDIVTVDKFNFKLRAERSGTGDGRVYTITYRVTDACGNDKTASATVTVPHSQGNNP